MSAARPSLTLLELPAAAAQARSKYLAQGFLLFVGLVFLVGTFIILRWSSQALEQQSVLWETRLSQAAYADAAHVAGQFEGRLAPWQRLANSDAMKLYIMQALDPAYPNHESARIYVENALQLAADRDDMNTATQGQARVPVNAGQGDAGAGVLLISAAGTPLLSIGSALPIETTQSAAGLGGNGLRQVGPFAAQDGSGVLLSYVVPVTQIQSDQVIAELHVTYVLGPRFLPPRAVSQLDPESSQFALVSGQTDQILSASLAGGQPAVQVRRAPALDGDGRYRWAAAVARSGTASALDAQGETYLVAAQAIEGSQWVAVRSVREDDALALVRRQTWIWLLLSFLALSLSCALILYAWRRGVAHRSASISAARETANQALRDANSFLSTVADTQPSALFVQNGQGQIIFANAAAADLITGVTAGELEGQSLPAILGPQQARPLIRAADTARATGQVITASISLGEGQGERSGRITAALLDAGAGDSRVVLSFDDLTDVIRLRAKREAALRQLVAVLTGLIDARDPYSAVHSRSVASLARRVGIALNYSEDAVRDLEMAALLSNAGKILIPRSVLTKPGSLTPEELSDVRTAVAKTSSLLGSVDFDGRVANILEASEKQQSADALDVQAAQIIKSANALAGMLSPRAHRAAMSIDAAIETLKKGDADLQVLAALEHVVRTHWSPIANPEERR